MTLDYGPLSDLARDLGNLSSEQVVHNVQKAVEQSARRVKDTWNAKLYSDGHANLTGRSITYTVGVAREIGLFQTDMLHGDDRATIAADIGPKRGNHKQAGVVRLLENGSTTNAPHGYGSAALGEHEADYEAALAFAIWAGEREAGL